MFRVNVAWHCLVLTGNLWGLVVLLAQMLCMARC